MKASTKQLIKFFRRSKAIKLREVQEEAKCPFSLFSVLEMTPDRIRAQSRNDLLRPRLRQRDTNRLLTSRKWLGEPRDMLQYI
jgi:hypothetical protein